MIFSTTANVRVLIRRRKSALGELLPLTHYVRMMRGILLRGSGIGDHLVGAVALVVFMLVTFALAIRLFKKEIG